MQLSRYIRFWLNKKARKLDTLYCFGEGKNGLAQTWGGQYCSICTPPTSSLFIRVDVVTKDHRKTPVNQERQPTSTCLLRGVRRPR